MIKDKVCWRCGKELVDVFIGYSRYDGQALFEKRCPGKPYGQEMKKINCYFCHGIGTMQKTRSWLTILRIFFGGVEYVCKDCGWRYKFGRLD